MELTYCCFDLYKSPDDLKITGLTIWPPASHNFRKLTGWNVRFQSDKGSISREKLKTKPTNMPHEPIHPPEFIPKALIPRSSRSSPRRSIVAPRIYPTNISACSKKLIFTISNSKLPKSRKSGSEITEAMDPPK